MNDRTQQPFMEPEGQTRSVERASSSFVIGILSLVFLLISPQIISLILGIIGISIGARDRASGCPKAEAGWIMSIIAVVLAAVIILFVILLFLVLIYGASIS